MSSNNSEDYSVAQTILAGHELQAHVERLRQSVDIESIPAGQGWSVVKGEHDGSKVLDDVKKEFKKEFGGSQETTDIVDAFATPPAKPYLVSRSVQLLVFQSGWSYLGDNCAVLIPVLMSGTINTIIEEQTSRRRTNLTLRENSEIMISGKSSILIPANSKAVCVMLGIGIGEDKR